MNEFQTAALVERAKAITLRPDETWPQIAAEPGSPGEIITRYAIPLAAIGPVASFIGGQVFGIGMIIATYRPSLMSGLTMAITSFVMALVSLIVIALVADFLAPKFDGEANRTQAFKLVAYSLTPGWVAGVLGLVPALSLLVIIAALYGIYLFYKGAAPVMKVPQHKATGFTAVTVVCTFVVNIVLATVLGSLAGLSAMGTGGLAGAMDSGDKVEINVPGVGTVDTAKMEQTAKQFEADMTNAQNAKAVDPSAIQAVLPASIGAYQRTSIESTGVGGVGATTQATYRSGDRQVQVQIVDVAGLGAVAGALGGMGIVHNQEDANGYERTRTVDGAIQTEKWNRKTSSGTFGTQVAKRFMATAEGEAASIDELKAIVAGVDAARLAALAQ